VLKLLCLLALAYSDLNLNPAPTGQSSQAFLQNAIDLCGNGAGPHKIRLGSGVWRVNGLRIPWTPDLRFKQISIEGPPKGSPPAIIRPHSAAAGNLVDVGLGWQSFLDPHLTGIAIRRIVFGGDCQFTPGVRSLLACAAYTGTIIEDCG